MDTASSAGEPAQPTEEEIREYTRQLRALPVERLVADAVSTLLNGAQAKLGRRDARLLIDLATISVEHARDHLPADLGKQVDDVLGQLRLAQVTAERERAAGDVEENDLDRMPAPPATGGAAPAAQPAPAASKLWVPGR